jgi:hypothetical protein
MRSTEVMKVSLINDPWSRPSWHGNFISVDGCDDTGFGPDEDNILYVIAYGDTGPTHWDGTAAGIVLLKDGRFVSWESNWGPTGSGFCFDAYGGDANIAFSQTLTMATRYISEQSREILVYYPKLMNNKKQGIHKHGEGTSNSGLDI